MDIHAKLAVLDQIYRIYDAFSHEFELACARGCAYCCTCNVSLTTLETYKIVTHLSQRLQTKFWAKLQAAAHKKRFEPRLTTNGIAELCIAGREPPQEQNEADWGNCPLLTDEQCLIYAVRPLGCRCLVSTRPCRETGYAVMDDFVLTVNTVFMQFIEHVDASGLSGNLIDVARWLQAESKRQQYINDRIDAVDGPLVANRPLKALLIPPEHRAKIEPILQALRDVRTPG